MITDDLIKYSDFYTKAEDELLQKLNRETNLKQLMPRMLSGHMQGRLLELISRMIKPKYILEVGTFTGYSAICLAKGLQDNGILHTIDINPELESAIKKYINLAGYENRIKLHIGDAIEVIEELDYKFDLVFLDADKENLLEYYKLVFEKVNSGGVILADNVLWGGKVLEEIKENDKETKGIVAFNKFILTDERVDNLLLPLRDGLQIIMKK